MFGNISRKEFMVEYLLGKFENKDAAYLLKMNFAIDVLLRIFRTAGFKSSYGWLFLNNQR